MARYLSYNDEINRLRMSIDTVSSDDEPFSEEDGVANEEYDSNHDSGTENDSYSESETEGDPAANSFIGKDKMTKWNKTES